MVVIMKWISTKSSSANLRLLFSDLEDETRKDRLISECRKHDISYYVDDASYDFSKSIFRPVASEVELERRLAAINALNLSKRSNRISFFALFISLISLMAGLFYK